MPRTGASASASVLTASATSATSAGPVRRHGDVAATVGQGVRGLRCGAAGGRPHARPAARAQSRARRRSRSASRGRRIAAVTDGGGVRAALHQHDATARVCRGPRRDPLAVDTCGAPRRPDPPAARARSAAVTAAARPAVAGGHVPLGAELAASWIFGPAATARGSALRRRRRWRRSAVTCGGVGQLARACAARCRRCCADQVDGQHASQQPGDHGDRDRQQRDRAGAGDCRRLHESGVDSRRLPGPSSTA